MGEWSLGVEWVELYCPINFAYLLDGKSLELMKCNKK